MKHLLRSLLVFALLVVVPCAAAPVPALEHARFLSDPKLEGRLTGSDGEHKAAAYIIEQFRRIGVRPLPGHTDYRVPFLYTAETDDTGSSLRLFLDTAPDIPAYDWTTGEDILALSFTESGIADSPIVFAGYGIITPEGSEVAYDSYGDLDVRGKIVLVLDGAPTNVPTEVSAALVPRANLRYKLIHARDRGAAALLVVVPPGARRAGRTIPLNRGEGAVPEAELLCASVSSSVTNALFLYKGGSLNETVSELSTGVVVPGFEFPRVRARLQLSVERLRQTGYNIVGWLPPNDGPHADDVETTPTEIVFITAHYDHIGRMTGSSSFARKGEVGAIHPGADDNASGTSAVLEMAEKLAALKRQRPLGVAFFSGEELGLLGSKSFLREKTIEPTTIAADLNFDMVGRMQNNQLYVEGLGSSPGWRQLLEDRNAVIGFHVHTDTSPYSRTDSTSFYEAGVPVLQFFTGFHEDYHRPSDTFDKLNVTDLERVVSYGTMVTYAVLNAAEPPEFTEVERPWSPSPRDRLRVTLGIVPDYTETGDGLWIASVMSDGPAAAAGLRNGDRIVRFDGQRVANIHDYMFALEAAKPGDRARIAIIRDGVEQTIEVKLQAPEDD